MEEPDTDGDGIDDGEEVNSTKTSPVLADTDSDCLSDDEELLLSDTSPLEANPHICTPSSDPTSVATLTRISEYSGIEVNEQSSTLYYALPGESMTLSAQWNIESPSDNLHCPGCVIQFYLGIRDVFSRCLTSRTFPPGSDVSGTMAPISFEAPEEPGVYYITQHESLQYECVTVNHSADPGKATATIVVMGG